MKTGSKIVLWILILALVAGAVYWTYTSHMKAAGGNARMGMGSGPIPMPVIQCEIRDVTDYHEFTGTTEAISEVEVRSRIQGYLQEIHFTDGDMVEKGQLLFTIEPELFLARRDEALARLNAAEAELERAQLDLERTQTAITTNAVSKQDLSRSKAAYHTAEANVAAAKAMVDAAQLDVSYTKITSPIHGRISRHLVDVGNLVSANGQTLLTTVIQVHPIYVSFYAEEKLLHDPVFQSVITPESEQPVPFRVGLASETGYPHEGTLNFLDNTVDPMTGTVYVRGQIDNARMTLLPGMYVRVKVPGKVHKDAVLLDEKVINTDLDGKYVLAVGQENKLEQRYIVPGQSEGSLRVIKEGLDGSELILSSGFYMARSGMQIIPMLNGQPPAGMDMPGGGPSDSQTKSENSHEDK